MPGSLKLTILTPEGIGIKDIPVKEVIVPAANGFLGVRPGHAPLMSMLTQGDIKYIPRDSEKTEIIGIYKGFAEVLNDEVLILALDKQFAEMLEFEEAQQAARKKKQSGMVAGDDMNLDEASVMINHSIAVLNNLRQNAKKQKRGL